MKKVLVFFIIASFLSGCAVTFKKTPPEEVKKAKLMKKELVRLRRELGRIEYEKSQEIKELREAKEDLEKRFKEEIGEKELKLELLEKGLVLRFVAEVLFDSGKANLKKEAYPILDKVANFLISKVPDRDIAIEGHTDNEPIKYSGWKSNWELSTARALSVLHYFVDKKGIKATRVSAIGYGEYRPIASNDTPEGRQKNRRVEIVILPKKLMKIRQGLLEEIGNALKEKERRVKEYIK
jgi:chemotaxis protein MotB